MVLCSAQCVWLTQNRCGIGADPAAATEKRGISFTLAEPNSQCGCFPSICLEWNGTCYTGMLLRES